MKNKPTIKTCKECEGKCCRYIAVEVDAPEDKEDFHHFRWFLMHKNVVINHDIDEDEWYVEFRTKCKNLTKDNFCKIHPENSNKKPSKYGEPLICQEHSMEDCELYGEGITYDKIFTTVEEFEKFIEKNMPEIINKEPEEDKHEDEE